MNSEQRKVTIGLLHLFKVDGVFADEIATEGQLEIFYLLVFRPHLRVQILTSTQYGKSLFVALACIIITCIQGELVAVLAPTNEKAKIIMRYYVEHLADSPLFSNQLEKDTKLDRLRMEENKDRIILRNGGGIFIISVQAGNSKKGVEAAMGAGAKNVIMDEACLIPDEIEATAFRMIAGKGPEAFYCKIGNPFYRNHFLKSWKNSIYFKVFIDYKQAILEGRYNEEFIAEARKKPKFDILFACEFPAADALDQSGYSLLFTEEHIRRRIRKEVSIFGLTRWGIDIAGDGSNFSTIIERGKNGAQILYKEHNPDTMNFCNVILDMYKNAEIKPEKIYVDKVGIGKGPHDRLKEFPELKDIIIGVAAGQPADDTSIFFNKRAEMYWRIKEWLAQAHLLGEDFIELAEIRYKVQSDRKLLIKSKKDMVKDGVQSPDVADGLSLTFYEPDTFVIKSKAKQEAPTSKYEGTLEKNPAPTHIVSDEDLAHM